MIYALDLRADDLQHLLLDLIALGGRDEQPHGAIVVDDALPQLDSRKLAHLEVRRSAPALIDTPCEEGDDMKMEPVRSGGHWKTVNHALLTA